MPSCCLQRPLEVRNWLRGFRLDGISLFTCSAALSVVPDLHRMPLVSANENSFTGLYRHLAALSSLQSLDLSKNYFQADSAAALGPNLAVLSSLQSLNLSSKQV
jgi:hypothetical protein